MSSTRELELALDELAVRLDDVEGIEIERHVRSGPCCTYRVGGPINVLAKVQDSGALQSLARHLAEIDVGPVPTLPVGKGSNLLIAEAGFLGVGVVAGSGFSEIDIDGSTVRAGAACPLPLVARATVREHLSGFEWAVGVPGTIGGGVRMNAGGHGSDMAANLVSVDIVDLTTGRCHTKQASELHLGYRTSNIEAHQFVSRATLELDVQDPEDQRGENELSEIVRWRRANQPGGQNAGSVFTNPPDDSAGRLIDAAGLKGHRVGSAEVSTVHANFIQVDPNGSADDVMALMEHIVDVVEASSGIRLHAETRLVGFSTSQVSNVQRPAGDQ